MTEWEMLEQDIQTVWQALLAYREDCISTNDAEWERLAEAMTNLELEITNDKIA